MITFHWFDVLMSYFVSGSYIQYICISLLNYPHVHFWKWNKDKEMWQSDVILWHWSSTLFLTEGSRQIASERRRLLCVIPLVVSISCSLRNGWLVSLTAKFASSLLPQCAKCTVAMMQAEELRQRWSHSWAVTAPWCLKHKIRGLIYIKVVQQIWSGQKKNPHLGQYFLRLSGKKITAHLQSGAWCAQLWNRRARIDYACAHSM